MFKSNKIKKYILSILCVAMIMVSGLSVSAHEASGDESDMVIVETRAMGVYFCPTHNLKLNGQFISATAWVLISTTPCPLTSVGQGDPIKYHYTYIRTATYRHICPICSHTVIQITDESTVSTNCGVH